MNINETIQSDLRTVKMYTEQVELAMRAATIFGDLDLSDISYWTLSALPDGKLRVEMSLDSDRRDSKVMHKIAQRLKMKLTKSKNWDNSSLVYDGENDTVSLQVRGAVPKTCKIVETTEPLSEAEIAAAHMAVKTVRVTRKIVCK